jgi:ABC-type uncharacterized transport system substrate-binding protein
MRELGYVEGKDYLIEWRFAGGDYARLPELAKELIALKVNVLFATSTAAILAAHKETNSVPIVMGSLAKGLPLVVVGPREYALVGAVMSYGASVYDLFRPAATYVDKIMKGAKPGDLPIEQPTKFDLVVNLKAAKHLGFRFPTKCLPSPTT